MTSVHCWMHPTMYRTRDGVIRCRFYTSDGTLHDKPCRWNRRLNAWTFRFRRNTWIATRTPAAMILG